MTAIEYIIYEQPQQPTGEPPLLVYPILENPTTGKPVLENPTTDNPTTEKQKCQASRTKRKTPELCGFKAF